MDSLKKELGLQDEVLNLKLILKGAAERDCEECESALQHESKLHIYSTAQPQLCKQVRVTNVAHEVTASIIHKRMRDMQVVSCLLVSPNSRVLNT